ncbi:hydroxymethylglutaryl-CoA lyase [Variovorax sp. YR750]|uniref:hydroxymethylglutaryl-CoA lyase n=1 Tax=Variovorax sp. YR750 TaxID=1884384 RepID=UPI0008B245DF|nr:hydroxymethylglutaryl-CoA lyase [Variovorax sp. YR750]SEM05972.1 hydroxymethylglutaryl-CoA lyase [Variovorax sp. YR750]
MHITISEVGPRDGLQSEKTFIPTARKVQIIDAIFASGIRSVEATSFVSPSAVPQMSDAAEVLRQIQRPERSVVSVLAPNVRGAHGAIRAGADELVAFVSASETHNRKNLNRSVAESLANIEEVAELATQEGVKLRAAIATAFGCPFEGNITVDSVVRVARAFVRTGVRHLTLADTTGMATPSIVRAVCESVRNAVPDVRISLHFHNTRGLGLLNVAAGIELQIQEYESSIAGVGGCPFAPGATGNVCTEDLVHYLHEEGHSTGIDLDSLVQAAWLMEEVLGRALPGQVMRAGKRLRRYDARQSPDAKAR